MQKFEYYAPTKIEFGKGTEEEAGRLCKEFGATRVFIAYGSHSAQKSGLIDRVEKSIISAGLVCEKMGGVVANPLLSTVRKMIDKASKFNADFILAIGGGSVIDNSKAVAHGVANPDVDVWDFWTRKKELTKSLPVGAILTISAAGSETSDSSVITNDEGAEWSKRGLSTSFNRCKFAIMNPELTYTLPKYQIGAGAADIFMHTQERYFAAILGNHLTDEIAEGLFRDIIYYGPIGVNNPTDYEAMSEIMWCGSVSHVGLTGIGAKGDTARDGDWSCHQLGMAISALYDSTHGATLSAVWSSWARYVCDANISRFATFARKVYGITESDDKKACDMGIDKTNEFFKLLGMPITITELLGHRPTDDELKRLAANCSYNHTRNIGSFKELTEQDMYEIYKLAC